MKRLLLAALLAAAFSATAQNVGINTNTPATTLQVVGQPATSTIADGVTIPSLTGNQLKAKDSRYTAVERGTLVYITAAASPVSTKTTNVTAAGFYYFDGSVWQKVLSAAPAKGQLLNSVYIGAPALSVTSTSYSGSGSTAQTTLLTYSYPPVSANSTILVQYHNSSYTISGYTASTTGTNSDEFQSRLLIGTSTITINTQTAGAYSPGGNGYSRTGTLFPITGVATNTNTSAKTITIRVQRTSGDDNISSISAAAGTLIIQEIAN